MLNFEPLFRYTYSTEGHGFQDVKPILSYDACIIISHFTFSRYTFRRKTLFLCYTLHDP